MRTRRHEYLAAGPLSLSLDWDNGVLLQLDVDWSNGKNADSALSDAGQRIQECLERYVRGERVEWPRVPLALHDKTPFQQRVYTTLRDTVHYGETISYGELAARAGSPKACRAIGTAMARNPWPVLVPCHRVLSSSGLGGFSAGLDIKRLLLELEGHAPATDRRFR